jgi:hypothetical protein
MKKLLMFIWLFAGIYFVVASAGGGGFVSPTMAMICGFMIARNFADIDRSGVIVREDA